MYCIHGLALPLLTRSIASTPFLFRFANPSLLTQMYWTPHVSTLYSHRVETEAITGDVLRKGCSQLLNSTRIKVEMSKQSVPVRKQNG